MIPNRAQTDFLTLLLEENKRQNLTGILEPEEAYARHIEDALRLFSAYPLAGKRVIDVGTGGGVPGLPLRIQEPSVRLSLLDATEKKVAFLRSVCKTLDLADVVCLSGRAEELGNDPAHRAAYDVAVARGVAYLPLLCELCLPFVAVGGAFLAMKQGDCDEEYTAARAALSLLGGVPGPVTRYTVLGQTHAIIRIDKVKPTPKGYPRRFAQIKAHPL